MLSQISYSNGQLPPSMNNPDPRPDTHLPEQPWLDAASLSLTSSVVLSSNLLAALEGAPMQCSTLKKGLGEEVLPLFDEGLGGLEDFWNNSQGKSGLEDFWNNVEGQGGRDMVAMQQMLSCTEEGEKTTVLWNNDLDDEEKGETQYDETVLFQRDTEESCVISDDEETIPFDLDSDMCPNQSPSVASSLELLPSSHNCNLALLYLPKLACTQEGQHGQEEEQACTREGRPGQELELACTREGRPGQELELTCSNEGRLGQEEKLACTNEGRPGQEEEQACTQEGQPGQEKELACTQEGQPGQEKLLACTREGRPGQEEEPACSKEVRSGQVPGQGTMRKLEGGQDAGPRKRIFTGY